MVGLPVDIFLNIVRGGVGARLGEIGGMVGFRAGLKIDFFDRGLIENPFFDQLLLKNLNGILGFSVFFDLLLAAVSVIRIGDGVAAVAVGVDFDGARLVGFASQGEKLIHAGAHFVNVVAVALAPGHIVALGAFGELAGGGARLAGAHRPEASKVRLDCRPRGRHLD